MRYARVYREMQCGALHGGSVNSAKRTLKYVHNMLCMHRLGVARMYPNVHRPYGRM